jgi:hypothetical protein
MRRALVPILMLAAAAVLLAVYNLGISDRSSQAPTATPEPTAISTPAVPQTPFAPATSLTMPSLGARAPDFTILSVGGDAITLSSYLGHSNVVLVFYRTGG